MGHENEARGEGSSPSRQINDARPPHGRWPRAVCPCADCTASMQRHLLSIGASRARLAKMGKHVPPLPSDADRYGLGDDCPDCDGNGVPDCPDCSGSGYGHAWSDGSVCSTCYGDRTADECERCRGEGVLLLRRCDQCGHLSEARELKPDDRLAALRNWSGTAWVCSDCLPCENCPAYVHADVVTDDGLCPACAVKGAVFAPPRVALLPERCASFLRAEAGSETVEHAIVVGVIVTGLVAVIALIAVGVMKALRNLRGEIDPGRSP